MTDSLFYILAGALLLFSFLVVQLPNLIHAAITLIASFFVTAALYLLMRMEFVAAAQVMVYIGGIVVFMVMAILLTTRLGEENRYPTLLGQRLWGLLVAAGVTGFLLTRGLGLLAGLTEGPERADPAAGGLVAVGQRLLATGRQGFIVPFEIISLLLLAALIGAVVLARREEETQGDES